MFCQMAWLAIEQRLSMGYMPCLDLFLLCYGPEEDLTPGSCCLLNLGPGQYLLMPFIILAEEENHRCQQLKNLRMLNVHLWKLRT